MNIVDKIFNFSLKGQKQRGHGLKTDALKALYITLLKEQELKNNIAQKIMPKNCKKI